MGPEYMRLINALGRKLGLGSTTAVIKHAIKRLAEKEGVK